MVNNELVTQDNMNNFDAMSKLLGVANSSPVSEKKTSMLARVKILHTPIMGEQEISGKMKNIEVVEGGSYAIQLPDDTMVYSKGITIQPYVQRFSYKRYVQSSSPDSKGYYHKTVMADNLNSDLHDNRGTFNCGKPAGYIKDFKALSEDMQALIKTIKRVRVIFGLITLDDPVDSNGASIKVDDNIPFIFEVDNRTSFTTSGVPFDKLSKLHHLPYHYTMKFTTEEQKLPTGAVYYTVVAVLNPSSTKVPEADTAIATSFLEWVDNHNDYIMNDYKEHSRNKMSDDDIDIVDEFLGSPDLEGVS